MKTVADPKLRQFLLHKQLHKFIRSEVRSRLGMQNQELKKYYKTYKSFFIKLAKKPIHTLVSGKKELLLACTKSNLILIGDYHTFEQAQRSCLRLLGS